MEVSAFEKELMAVVTKEMVRAIKRWHGEQFLLCLKGLLALREAEK